MEDIKISVVIPFYNAREFITQAVESALSQPETGEVIIIEDASPDNGIEICQSLSEKYVKVRLFQHPDRRNHGEPASRNLGIVNSNFPYIAFLDADDYFLPNRFKKTIEVFQKNADCDGVYEAIGVTFQNQSDKEFWSQLPFKDLTTVTKIIEPNNLFEELMNGKNGYFSVDGLTVRKKLLKNIGYFNEDLRYMSDTDCILKLSAKGNLYPGSIGEPVSIRRVHKNNRITTHFTQKREIYKSHVLAWESLEKWGKKELNQRRYDLVLFALLRRYRKADYFGDTNFGDFLSSRKKMVKLAIANPFLFRKLFYYRLIIPSTHIVDPILKTLQKK